MKPIYKAKMKHKSNNMLNIKDLLGKKFKDKFNGFEGVCTAVIYYIDDDNPSLRLEKEGEYNKDMWCNFKRVEVIENESKKSH